MLAWGRSRYRRLHVMGFSLGGAIAIHAVSRQRDGVEALIAVSAPAAFEDIEFKFWTLEAIRRGLQGVERGAGCPPGNPFLKKQRPIDHIARLEGVPLLFVHGTNDVIVGVRHSHRLFAAAKEPKRLEMIEGGAVTQKRSFGMIREDLFNSSPHGSRLPQEELMVEDQHIKAHSHMLLLIWLMGILPMVYVLRSLPMAGLASVL